MDGTSFSDAGSLVTTAHLTREICPRDLKYRKSKTNIVAQKLLLSEIGSKQKLSFGRRLLSNSVCVRRTLFVAQCPKFKATVSISMAINLVGDREQFENYRFSPYGPTVSRQITCLLFSCSKLVFAADYKWVCLLNFVIESCSAPSTNDL